MKTAFILILLAAVACSSSPPVPARAGVAAAADERQAPDPFLTSQTRVVWDHDLGRYVPESESKARALALAAQAGAKSPFAPATVTARRVDNGRAYLVIAAGKDGAMRSREIEVSKSMFARVTLGKTVPCVNVENWLAGRIWCDEGGAMVDGRRVQVYECQR